MIKLQATQQEIMTAKLFFNAAFPVMQVLINDDPKLQKKFAGIRATVQFGALDDIEPLFCRLVFDNGKVTVEQGRYEKQDPADSAAQSDQPDSPDEPDQVDQVANPGTVGKPDLSLTFSSIAKMNALLKGGLSLPSIRGRLSLLPSVLSLLMGLKIMTKDNAKLKNIGEKTMKVKCSLYMVARALSQYNKLGDPDMQEFCMRQPDRIYQFRVEHEGKPDYIACYLRIKAGKSKSGHGVYERRSPFVLFRFLSVDGALKVLGREVEFVEGVEKGFVETVGSPEYAMYLNDYMAVLQGMLT